MKYFVDYFSDSVTAYPTKPAAVFKDQVMTYAELDWLSGRIATYVNQRGVGAEDIVLICLPRGIEALAAMIGVLKAGAAFCFLSPDYPEARTQFIVKDIQAKVLFEEKDLALLPQAPLPMGTPAPQDAAIVVYTSGSTGNPKGVINTQYGLALMMQPMLMDWNSQDISCCTVSFSFIAIAMDALVPVAAGGTVHILDNSTRADVSAMIDYCNRTRVMRGFFPPQMLNEILKRPDIPFKKLWTGSERVVNIYSKEIAITNWYGASETCGPVVCFHIDKAYENTPICAPFEGSRIYLLDDAGKEAPCGVKGEICVCGQVAKGYVNLPELTAEKFIKNPFATGEGEEDSVLFRTGDIGMITQAGELVYVQRKDWMLKIRGFRVEPSEIEAAIIRLTKAEKVAVVGYTNAAGNQSLYAAYTAAQTLNPDKIKEEISAFLPNYMIPAVFEQLNSLPLNANGKVDRKSLVMPDLNGLATEYVPPKDEAERALCEAFGEVLGIERVGALNDFVLLGGDSAAAARLQTKLPCYAAVDILGGRTPRQIAKTAYAVEQLPLAEEREIWPLTPSEQGMLVVQQFDRASISYNVSLAFELRGVLDVPALEKALATLVERHRILRSYYPLKNGEFVHCIAKELSVTLVQQQCEKNVLQQTIDAINLPYNLSCAPLFRFMLFKTADSHILYWGFHHTIVDGLSINVLAQDLWQLYDKKALTPARPDYLDYTAHIGEPDWTAQEAFFGEMFALGVPENEMPTHPVRPEKLPFVDAKENIVLHTETVELAARKLGVTTYSFLFAVLGMVLGKYCGSEDVVLGTAMHGRTGAASRNMVGMFVNTLPVRLKPQANRTFAEYALDVSGILKNVRANQGYPFQHLVSRFAPDRNPSRAPIFDVEVNYLNETTTYQIAGLEARPYLIQGQQLAMDFQIEMRRNAEEITIDLLYSEKLYLPEVARGFINQIKTTIEKVMQTPSLALVDAVELPENQRQQILLDFAGEKTEEDVGKTLVSIFREQAARVPNRPAVKFGTLVLSYAQLDMQTDRLAAALYNRGVERGSCVGILVGRSEMMPVCALGALKSGAAYLPMDATYPTERLEYMLDDAKVKLIIADRELVACVPEFAGEFLYTDEIERLPQPTEVPPEPQPQDLMVLLYTSGTTGNPKGVMLCHYNLVHFCSWYRCAYQLTEQDGVAAYASFGFDACLMDMYPTLTAGAQLHIIPTEMRLDLEGLNDYIEKNGIGVAFMTTQLGRQFVECMQNKALRALSIGGEALVPIEPPQGFSLYNLYGPTECTILVTQFLVDGLYDRIPIGRAIANTRLYVLDKHDRLAPVGVAGELCIAGRSVAAGYLNRPDSTEQKFTKNPFSEEADYQRIYRTGDIVRFLPDGNIDFVGRRDFQVKIRGFRVELTEIEGRIREYPLVKDAAVVALDAPAGGKCAVAYIISDTTVEIEALNRFIEDKLPPYMVPTATIQIEEIPLTPNGKVDRRKLPPPEFGAGGSTEKTGEYVQTELGYGIKQIVTELLACADITVTANLLQLGLSSLSAIKLAIKLENQYQVSVPAKDILANPTMLATENRIVHILLTHRGEATDENLSLGPVVLEDVGTSKLEDEEDGTAQIREILREVLGPIQVDGDEDLIRAGLTSLSTIKLVTKLKNKFGVAPKVNALLEKATVNGIAQAIAQEQAEQAAHPEGTVQETLAGYPLSASQLGVYLDCIKRPDALLYNIPVRVDMPENVDAKKLCQAVADVIDAHPVIKMYLQDAGVEIQQVPCTDPALVSLLEMTEEELKAHLSEFSHPFNLNLGPLYRAAVVVHSGKVSLLADFHHIIFDGASLDIFLHEVAIAYAGETLEAEQMTAFQAALLEQHREGTEEWLADKAYFDGLLMGIEGASEIAGDMLNSKGRVGHPREVVQVLNRKRAEEFCRSNGFTPAGLFFAVVAYTVSRWTGNRTAALSTISSGRGDPRLQNSFGMFVRTLPLALTSEGEQTVRKYIQKAQECLRGVMQHESYSYVQISADHGFTPSIMYACELGVVSEHTIDGQPLKCIPFELESPKFKVSIHVEERDGEFVFAVQYDDALYSSNLMTRFVDTLVVALEHMLARPDAAVCTVSLMSESERVRVAGFHSAEEPSLLEETLHGLYERAVDNTPDAVALLAPEGKYSYKALEEQANALAHALLEMGICKEDRVAFLLPRGGRVLVAMLGILKAGGCYLPLDPAYPKARVAQIMMDSGAKWLLTVAEYGDCHEQAIEMDVLCKHTDKTRPSVGVTSSQLAYMIYTSGSTGKPKGVMIEHHSIANYVSAHPQNRHVQALVQNARCMLSITTVTFDMFLKESMTVLCNGLTLVMADDATAHDPIKLAELFEQTGADAFNTTPSRMMEYTAYPTLLSAIRRCKVIMAGAEQYPAELAERLLGGQGAERVLLNTYGPTETTVSCNAKIITAQSSITVGAPLMGVREFVMDLDKNELPTGVIGELWIGGRGVARGYLNMPEQTEKLFLLYAGARIYRSGDLARWTESGEIEVLGRSDGQVKLRGLRIELGEVEGAVCAVAGVTRAVAAIKNVQGAEQLCVYYTAQRNISPKEVRQALKQTLADYMVPTAYRQLESIPLNANGKTDKKLLPEPELLRTGEYMAPQSGTEKAFCDVFAEVLELQEVGVLDNFFEIGGTSLSVTRVVIAAQEKELKLANGAPLSYGDVFANPTPQELARLLQKEEAAPAATGEMDAYDYKKIKQLLTENTMEACRKGLRTEPGRVLLTGATGFLGAHMLRELLADKGVEQVICVIRKGRLESVQERLTQMMFYYFEYDLDREMGNRVVAIEGDITDAVTLDLLLDKKIDTVINCAANVSHFAAPGSLLNVNTQGVSNLIEFCLKTNAKLVQISTASIAGFSIDDTPARSFCMTEQMLYFGQNLDNQYAYSKFLAERCILEAAEKQGLRAKIMRVGNLMARNADGEFQINAHANSFIGNLRAYHVIGCFPYSGYLRTTELAPIDSTTQAILQLLRTSEECRVFHPFNNYTVFMGDLIAAMKAQGLAIEFVEDDIFAKALSEAMKDKSRVERLTNLVAYQNMAKGRTVLPIPVDNQFTTQVLLRRNWSWPQTGGDYMEKFLKYLIDLGYFIT